MTVTLFAKKKKTKEGKAFTAYIGTLTRKDGTTQTVAVKFHEDLQPPKVCPCNIIVDKRDGNMARSTYTREDTGELAESFTLWISKYTPGPEYVDHSLDDFED